MRAQNPKASIKSLVHECMKQFPQVGSDDEYVGKNTTKARNSRRPGKIIKGATGRMKSTRHLMLGKVTLTVTT